ncbi:MAG: DUF465 domain-containing protein [Rhodobacteraceae bacterium]|nr:DUF465 domain-containing protein [Paracoccaceae bacterium]
MSETEFLQTLIEKHKALSEKVEAEQKKPSSDYLTIAQLKKEKLYLKEKIAELS